MSRRGRHSVQKGFAAATTLSHAISNKVAAHFQRWNIKTRCTRRKQMEGACLKRMLPKKNGFLHFGVWFN
jgi:hypothetical protein